MIGDTMLNLNSIMLGSENPKALAEFYEKVLEKKPDMVDGEWSGFSAGSCYLSMGPHDQVKGQANQPERIMFTFETKAVDAEFNRLKEAGASVIKAPYHMGDNEEFTIATLADPDGNFFQLMSPWED